MWQIRIEETPLRELYAQGEQWSPVEVTVSRTVIRDGTPGISLSCPKGYIGEWTDSGSSTVSLSPDYRVIVHGLWERNRYAIILPGKVIAGEEVSDTAVRITVQL